MKNDNRQNLPDAGTKISGGEMKKDGDPFFGVSEENDSISEECDSEAVFEHIRNHRAAEALLASLGDYFDKRFADEYDEMQLEMEDISLPDDLDQQMRTLVRKHDRDAGKQASVQQRKYRTGMSCQK